MQTFPPGPPSITHLWSRYEKRKTRSRFHMVVGPEGTSAFKCGSAAWNSQYTASCMEVDWSNKYYISWTELKRLVYDRVVQSDEKDKQFVRSLLLTSGFDSVRNATVMALRPMMTQDKILEENTNCFLCSCHLLAVLLIQIKSFDWTLLYCWILQTGYYSSTQTTCKKLDNIYRLHIETCAHQNVPMQLVSD